MNLNETYWALIDSEGNLRCGANGTGFYTTQKRAKAYWDKHLERTAGWVRTCELYNPEVSDEIKKEHEEVKNWRLVPVQVLELTGLV